MCTLKFVYIVEIYVRIDLVFLIMYECALKSLHCCIRICHANIYMHIQFISEISKVLNVMYERNVMNCCVTSDKYFLLAETNSYCVMRYVDDEKL